MTKTFKFPETDLIGCRFPQVTGRNGQVTVDPNTKEYVYRLLPGMDKPKLGDLVVCSCINGFQVCVVTSLNATTNYPDVAYVVGVVDTDAYTDALARKEAREKLYAQMMAKKKELEELVTLDLLAERSPEFKELLDAYRALKG